MCAVIMLAAIGPAAAGECTPTGFVSGALPVGITSGMVCMKLGPYSSETGYYQFEGVSGPSPTITVKIGDTITFDQSDNTNWYHPVGVAYEPDVRRQPACHVRFPLCALSAKYHLVGSSRRDLGRGGAARS